ncbi:MAG: hypothetical protein R3C05_23060 [Pirellulaceae bacterium]
MTLHLHVCHGGCDNTENWPVDWHWHWELPSVSDGAWGSESNNPYTLEQLFGEREWRTDFAVAACGTDWATRTPSVLVGHSLEHARTFLEVGLLHSRLSLPEFFGTMRC